MLTDLLPLMTYCFVMSSTPGPNNVMLATSGAKFGYLGALPQILGQNTGVAIQTFITCMGLGSVFVAYPVLHQILRITGAVYLLYLAWKLSGSSMGAARESKPLTFWQAALFQGVNPKTWVKSVTLASVFMPIGMSLPMGALLVTVIGSLIGLPSASMWALFGVAIRQLLTDPIKQRVFNLTMGAMLVVLAVSFLR
ncbi:LysE family translocator [Rhodoferax aquaticus]|uniref:LysE family translocator n=1 Tax=Rhodoferax aquaticus TaxID=2527691 RepID=UPI001F3488ED|nr:LysE family translocator [Rhodoferax aquaticus]